MKHFKTQNTADRKFTVMALYTFNILIGCILAIYKGVILENTVIGFILLLLLNMWILDKESIRLINKYNLMTNSKLPHILTNNMVGAFNVFMLFDILVNGALEYNFVAIILFMLMIASSMFFNNFIIKAVDFIGRI